MGSVTRLAVGSSKPKAFHVGFSLPSGGVLPPVDGLSLFLTKEAELYVEYHPKLWELLHLPVPFTQAVQTW